MPKVYLIHGFIGSGKTTFAKQLELKTKAKRFTPDEIIAERYGSNLSIQEIRNANLTVKDEIWKEVEKLAKENKDIILDYGLWKKQQRIDIVNKVKELGATPIFYEVTCNLETMRNRALNRNEDGNINITADRYDLYHQRFEPMDDDEERITINTNLTKN